MTNPIMILNGSARDDGNTEAIIKEFIAGALAVGLNSSHIKLRNLNIANCIGCYTCKHESKCSLPDAMTEIRENIVESELLVFASPVYWCEITGLLKTCIDRLYFYHHSANSALIAGKNAIIITTMGESENIEYESEVLVEFYKRALKSLQITILDMLFYSDLMAKEDILKKPKYLDQAFAVGKSLKTRLKSS